MQPVEIIPVKESGTTELAMMQLHIEDLIFRWTQAGAPIIPSMKDSIESNYRRNTTRIFLENTTA